MLDLYFGLALMGVLSLGAFVLGVRLSAGHRWIGNGLAITTVLLTVFYVRFGWDDIRLARLLPFSNLVIVGNCLPLLSTFLSGVVWRRIQHWRRFFGVAALWIAGGYAAVAPLLPEPPVCEDTWTNNGICLQTNPATCTPACAATLLRIHDITSTEREMARLCLTGPLGTNWTGLYHGLKVKTRDTGLEVRVFFGSAKDLLDNPPGPVILSVGLPFDTRPDSYYRTKWPWTPGVEHSVILLGTTEEGMLQIIDPDPNIKFELWHPRDLEALWRGQGMSLVPSGRDRSPGRHASR